MNYTEPVCLRAAGFRGPKFHSSAHNYELNLERTSNSSPSTHPVGQVLGKNINLHV